MLYIKRELNEDNEPPGVRADTFRQEEKPQMVLMSSLSLFQTNTSPPFCRPTRCPPATQCM